MKDLSLEELALLLNQAVRKRGKAVPRDVRKTVRTLLQEVYALSSRADAPPEDKAALSDALIAVLEDLGVAVPSRVEAAADAAGDESSVVERVGVPVETEVERVSPNANAAAEMDATLATEAELAAEAEVDTDAGPVADLEAEVQPYFTMVRVQVRDFFTLRACKEPVRIARSHYFAQKYAEGVFERVDRFLKVLQKDVDTEAILPFHGYRDDLIKDMPDRGLVLHPPKKRR